MAIFRNILIALFSTALTVLFVFGSFVFGTTNSLSTLSWEHEIKKSLANISTDNDGDQKILYTPYKTGSTASGFLSLEFGRLATAFVMTTPSPILTFSDNHSIEFQGLQGIVSLYDPFTSYSLRPKDMTYGITQITNGSFYLSTEPDGTISIYSIDIVMDLSFFDQGKKMTSMILFPGMYIRFDPLSNRELKWADLFRIMLTLGDEKNEKITGLEFINPRVDGGKGEDIFFVYRLPSSTRPLFQMFHILFRDRIKQVENLKSYTSNRWLATTEVNSMIYNPSKKNHYLLDDLRSVLSRAVQSQMSVDDFRTRIDKIHLASEELVKGNSIQVTLESFLTDARFATYWNSVANSKFGDIYTETANILGITPDTGKWKFFQYLSDIYSRNIVPQRKDPTFSGIDTYTSTAEWLKQTLENQNIESKDYFDIALYAYQLLQKAQDKQMLTSESISSSATYSLIEVLFGATGKYIRWLTAPEPQKSAYQTLVIQFYAPIANTIARSVYATYTTYIDNKIYLTSDYIDGDRVKFDARTRENLQAVYEIFNTTYEKVAPLYWPNEEQYNLIAFRDSIIRLRGFLYMISEWRYKEYQKTPYTWIESSGISVPSVTSDGKLQVYRAPISVVIPQNSAPVVSPQVASDTPVRSTSINVDSIELLTEW